jgi:hypothetical protein
MLPLAGVGGRLVGPAACRRVTTRSPAHGRESPARAATSAPCCPDPGQGGCFGRADNRGPTQRLSGRLLPVNDRGRLTGIAGRGTWQV